MKKIILAIAVLFPIILFGQSRTFNLSTFDGYTKSQLETSGSAEISSGNIIYEVETVSRTIYVSNAGSDETGDGSISLPYATFEKVLSTINKVVNTGVTITVHAVAGTYDLTADDLNTISLFQGSGTLVIEGELELVDSGFTMGSAEVDDPFTYAVSGGNSATWTENQWKFHFLKSGTLYYPITHNSTIGPTISIAGAVTGTEIYQSVTVINMPVVENININIKEKILRCKVVLFSSTQFVGSGGMVFIESYITSSSLRAMEWEINMYGNCARNSFENISFSQYRNNKPLLNSYVIANANNILFSFSGITMNLGNVVLENPNTGASAACIMHNIYSNNIFNASSSYIKFVNSNVCIRHGETTRIEHILNNLIIKNNNYFLRKLTTISDFKENIRLQVYTFYGAPNIRWFYDSMYEFVNPSSGRNIQIQGIIYPEFESNQSVTLTNNTTTTIQIGDSTQNASINIDYTVIRGDSVESGTLSIVNKMAKGLSLQESTPVGSDAGVTFSVSMITPKKITLSVLCTNTVEGTMRYNITRMMKTPLTL